MNKKKIWTTVALVIFLMGLGWLTKDRKIEKVEQVVKVDQVEQAEEETGEVKLILNFGEGEVSTYSAKINEGKTVLEILSQVAQENDFSLETKESDFGAFIEEISGVKNSQDQFWLFYVNDQMPSIGADQYQLKDGDVVEWKYEKIQN